MSADTETRRILRSALPPAGRLWGAIGLGVLSAGSALALLACSAWLITRASERPALIYVSIAVVGVRAFALGRAFFRYLERLSGHDAAFRQLAVVRSELFTRLVPLAPDGLGDTRRGDLLTSLTDDVDELQNRSLRVVQPLVTAGVIAAVGVVGTCLVLPEAGGALLAALIAAFVIGSLLNRSVSGWAERGIAPLRARLGDAIFDLTANLDVLTAFGALPTAQRRVSEASRAVTVAVRSRVVGAGLTTAVVSVLAGGATTLALLAGIPALASGRLDAPSLAVVALIPLAVFEVFGTIPLALGARRQVVASARRLATTVSDESPSGIPVDPAEPQPLRVSGTPVIELQDLRAHWPGSSDDVLTGIDLRLEPGERVLLTGPTGAGKTALAHVLVRFVDYSGRFLIDGAEAKSVAQDDVRRVIGLCEQEPYLFDSDVRQNLLFAKETATDVELMAVLDRVGLAGWVRERGGLDARVGEHGALVSGGQAQRIALARAILAEFPVLIVDEPAANVDAAVAERVVQDIMSTAAEDGRTVLMVSHTPVADDLVTRRVVLQDGRIRGAERVH